jgi:hypothetical protein
MYHKAIIYFFTVSSLINTPNFHRGNCKNKSIFFNAKIGIPGNKLPDIPILP